MRVGDEKTNKQTTQKKKTKQNKTKTACVVSMNSALYRVIIFYTIPLPSFDFMISPTLLNDVGKSRHPCTLGLLDKLTCPLPVRSSIAQAKRKKKMFSTL